MSIFAKRTTLVLILSILLVAVCAPGCGDDSGDGDTTATATGEAQVDVLTERADIVFSSVMDDSSDFPENLMTIDQLVEIVNDPQQSRDFFILDTRPRNEWEADGHIPGATWIRMQDIPRQESLDQLPDDKLIVCISPTGQTAVQVATTLRWLGYDAVLLEFGMGTWTPTAAGEGIVKGDALMGLERRYPVVTGSEGAYADPTMTAAELTEPDDAEFGMLQDAALAMMEVNVLEKEYPFNHIFADVLYGRLQDPAQKDSMFLLDIRTPENYSEVGHIEGAVNIFWRDLGKPENLEQLPEDKMIVVIGDTAMSAGQVTPILQMLGYDAVTLRGGMVAWTETPDSQRPIEAIDGSGYPVVFDE